MGPRPAPPPARLDTFTVLDLLATARRWRVNDPFVAGQADGLARALVACLNAGRAAPRWLRWALVAFLLEVLWERPSPRTGEEGRAWAAAVDDLVRRWREPAAR